MRDPRIVTAVSDHEKANHLQADSDGLVWLSPKAEGKGECCYELFYGIEAVYTRPPLHPNWRVTFFDTRDMRELYSFGDGKDQFTGKEYSQLLEIRHDAQQWVADVRALVLSGRARKIGLQP